MNIYDQNKDQFSMNLLPCFWRYVSSFKEQAKMLNNKFNAALFKNRNQESKLWETKENSPRN